MRCPIIGESPVTQTDSTPAGSWQLRDIRCDYCGAEDFEVVLEGYDRLHGLPGTFRVVACSECGLARTSPQPTPESLPTAYPATYPAHRPEQMPQPPGGFLRWALANYRGYPLGKPAPAPVRWLAWPAAALFLRTRRQTGYLPYVGEGRLLDLGCGAGRYVAKMAAAGWQAEGMDPSPEAVRLCREAGLTAHEAEATATTLAPGSYDVVTMWGSLEHVPSPKATLAGVFRLLAPRGLLLISVPRFDSLPARWFGSAWFALDLPRHLTHFSRAALALCVASAGLEVVWIRSYRRPAIIRKSFRWLADETGRRIHRVLGRSRIVVGLMALVAGATGRTGRMVCLARKPGKVQPT